MTTTIKKKIISGVALLCTLMLLIGILPTSVFRNNKVNAAGSDAYVKSWLYFDASNVSAWQNSDVYLKCPNWGTTDYKMTKVQGTNIYYLDTSSWNNLGATGEVYFFTSSGLRTTNLGTLNEILGNNVASSAPDNNSNVIVVQNAFSGDQYNCDRQNRDGQTISGGSSGGGSTSDINTNGDKSQDIPVKGNSKPAHDSNKLYLKSTFYDYYSDYEIGNGQNRTNISSELGYTNDRYVQAKSFDDALSVYYKNNNVVAPLYFGHFQWKQNTEGTYFRNILNIFNNGPLYGTYTTGDPNLTWLNRDFFHYNNSEFRKDCSNSECYDGVQSHTHETAVATQGLFGSELDENGNITLPTGTLYGSSTGTVEAPYFNKEFLRGNNDNKIAYGNVYEDIDFPFIKNSEGYWEFDSADANQTVRMKRTTDGQYYLDEVGSSGAVKGFTNNEQTTVSNFFPFNSPLTATGGLYVDQLNYGFGLTLDIPVDFNGQTVDENNKPFVFNFSGDDDVLIYIIDNDSNSSKLLLDIGGSHGAVTGSIDFNSKKVTVSKIKTTTDETSETTKSFSDLGFTFSSSKSYTLRMFYMERGLWESNMKVTFNMPIETQLDVEKKVDLQNVDSDIRNAISANVDSLNFNFEIGSASKNEPITDHSLNNCSNISTVTYTSNSNDGVTHISNFEGKANSIKIILNNRGGSTSNYGPIFSFNNEVDLEKIDYLYFWVYNNSSTSATGNPRITLYDSSGNTLFTGGYNGFDSDGSAGWLSVLKYDDEHWEFGSKTWKQIRISAKTIVDSIKNSSTGYNTSFNYNEVSKLTITTYADTTMYISDIGYYTSNGQATWNTVTPATAKTYTLNSNTTTNTTNNIKGAFTLKNKDIAHFVNQFKQGDALQVHEGDKFTKGSSTYNVADKFTTTWELYRGTTLQASGSNYYADDNTTSIENTFLFMGTTDTPDKVKFTNTLKTATITIKKQLKDADGNDLTFTEGKTFNFKVTFSNIGGMNLEGSNTIPEKTVSVTVPSGSSSSTVEITGIPVGTTYTIVETDSSGYDVDYAIGEGTTIVDSTNILNSTTTVTVTNKEKRQVGELILTKQIYVAAGTVPDSDKTKEFDFTVEFTGTESLTITDYTTSIKYQKGTKSGTNVTWGSDTDFVSGTWTADTTNNKITATIKVSENTPIKITNIPYSAKFHVTESGTTSGYIKKLISEPTNKTISSDVKTVGIVNEKVGSLTITKVDSEDNTTLSGAVFTLYTNADCTAVYGTAQTTYTNGRATFSNLPYGTYYLKETVVPAGYQSNNGVITVNVNSNTVNSSGNVSLGDGYTDNKITNNKIILPSTGGTGSNPTNYVLIGLAIVLVAGIGFVLFNRKAFYSKKN